MVDRGSTSPSTARSRRPPRTRRRRCEPRRSRHRLGSGCGSSAISSTRAAVVAAWRAAEIGPWPAARAQTYAARNASPAPVGSAISTRRAGTCSRTPPAITTRARGAAGEQQLGHAEREDAFLAAEGLELLLVQLQRGHVSQDLRVEVGVEHQRPGSRPAARAPARRARAGGRGRAPRARRPGSRRASARPGAPMPRGRRLRASATSTARRGRRPSSHAPRRRTGSRTRSCAAPGAT